ncbi:MAG: hypothetical protein AAB154_06680 [Candidatus Binatota bacterium]
MAEKPRHEGVVSVNIHREKTGNKIFLAKRTDKKYVGGVSFARTGMVIAASPEIAE